MKIKSAICLLILIITGCQSPGYLIEESNHSVKQHRIAITAALGAARSVSDNGRVILSYYHDRAFKNIEMTAKTKERLYTKVSVLGTRRPFSISVEVYLEQKDYELNRFYEVGLDDGLARKRALAIKEVLNQSPDKDTMFDEAPPF